MLRSLARFALPMLLLGLMISSATAQRPGGGGFGGGPGGFGGGGGGIFLLLDEKVRTDLGLVEDQTEKLRALARKMMEGMGGGGGGGQDFRRMSDEERTKFREDAQARGEKALKEVDDILLPAQRERFKQIQVQSRLRGGNTSDSLGSKEIAAALGITDAQKEELKKVQEEAEKELREKEAALRQELKDKVLKVLTTEQKAKLEKLMGAKIEFTQRGGPGGGGGQGGQGGRGSNRPAGNPTNDDN